MARTATANTDGAPDPNPPNATRACPPHMDEPSTNVTAERHRPDPAKHGAHQPNGSPAPRSPTVTPSTAHSVLARHHRRMPRIRIQPRRYDPLPAHTIRACHAAHTSDAHHGRTHHRCRTCARYTHALTLALAREQAAP